MSSVKISGNASGAGIFEIAAPGSATNRTQTLPDATGTVVLDSATQTLTNKTLTTPNINSAQFATVSGTAPIYPCRAWVNFDGTGTVAIRASGNVSSITDDNTGTYTVNFTTAMPDANYVVITGLGKGAIGVDDAIQGAARLAPITSTTSQQVACVSAAGTVFVDMNYVTVAVFR